jgi:hypothetical protein
MATRTRMIVVEISCPRTDRPVIRVEQRLVDQAGLAQAERETEQQHRRPPTTGPWRGLADQDRRSAVQGPEIASPKISAAGSPMISSYQMRYSALTGANRKRNRAAAAPAPPTAPARPSYVLALGQLRLRHTFDARCRHQARAAKTS